MIEVTREKEVAKLMKSALENIGLTKEVIKANCNMTEEEYESYLHCLVIFINEVINSKYNDVSKQSKTWSDVYENFKVKDKQYNLTFNGLYNEIVTLVTNPKEGE